MLYETILNEQIKLGLKINSIQSKINELPEGKLIVSRNGTRRKWYWTDGHSPVYLPKNKRALAEQLAHKKFLKLQLDNLLQEQKALSQYLKHHNSEAHQSEIQFLNSPEYKELLKGKVVPLSYELDEWMNSSYEKNLKFPETLIHQTLSGNVVRSKSEALIDMLLYQNQIPFRYECMLQLGETFIYPDFTIRHPKTGEYFYWEHFGMMDQPTYCKNAYAKMQLYTSYNIIPSIHLITTFETKEHPITPILIQKIIDHYFL